MHNILISKLIRSNRRTITISISPDAKLVVHAPNRMPLTFIQEFVNDKSDWILKHIETIKEKIPQTKSYTSGETFLYLGKEYTLHIGNYKEITFTSTLNFPKFLLFRIKKELEIWYMKAAREFIMQRLEHHATLMNTTYKDVFFSDTKSKWGTCGPDNTLQFNWRLIMAPPPVIDYVVIHELAHTKEKNHGTRFWKEVQKNTPAYRQHRKWLTTNAHHLVL
jgi:predicted metal-dependent hydrolase